MPFYEYKCPTCKQTEEVLKKITDDSPHVCIECLEYMKRVPSSAGVHFKGSGFYETDYKGK